MAIVTMQKVAVLAHHTLTEDVLALLHEAGVLEVIEDKGGRTNVDHMKVDFERAELKFLRDFLTPYATSDLLKILDRPASPEQIEHVAMHTDFRALIEAAKQIDEERQKLAALETEHRQKLTRLLPWQEYPYASQPETRYTQAFLGTVQRDRMNEFQRTISAEFPRTELLALHADKGAPMNALIAHVWKEDIEHFERTATTLGWTGTDVPLEALSAVKERIRDAELALHEIKDRKHVLDKECARLAKELPNIAKMEVFFMWLQDKQRVRESMRISQATTTIFGWIPKDTVRVLESKLHRLSPAIALLHLEPDADDETPILLRNAKWIAPFRSVTTLYGLPRATEADPTGALSFFFILFFALCLTDAGYGFVLALLTGLFIWKKKLAIEENTLIWLLFLSGIVTVFVSIPFGGWFGFAPTQVPEILTYTNTAGDRLFIGQIWNLSNEKGVTFLQNLALALGLTHLTFGMFLAGAHKWVHGDKRGAVWIDFMSHLLFAAVLFRVFGPEQFARSATYFVYIALALFIWGKGYGSPWYTRPIFGLLGGANFAIGLLSNSLSYLRILALGLVTGAIAFAVDQVAFELGNLFPIWLGIPVILLILFLGHAVSIALNVLGAFIHSGRLQFIEFFSQFFEGGGRPFSPFKRVATH